MALATTTPLFPPGLAALLRRRAAALSGIALATFGVMILLALLSYNPLDPSLDTATARPATNLVGAAGAVTADLLLQSFGLAGALPGFALLAWGWRIATHRRLSLATRLANLLAALPLLAGLLALLPTVASPADGPGALASLASAHAMGLGGAAGVLLAHHLFDLGGLFSSVLGPVGAIGITVLWLGAALATTICALGLGARDYRAAARVTGYAARGSAAGGQRLARWIGRLPAGIAWLFRPMLGTFEQPEETPIQPRYGRPEPTLSASTVVPTATARANRDVDLEPVIAVPPPHPATALVTKILPRKPPPTRLDPAAGQESLDFDDPAWKFPPLSLLKDVPARGADAAVDEDALKANARLLVTVLNDYGVQGVIRDIRPGPVVTLYELEPAPGIKATRVIGLADDVALNLSVHAVRVATVPERKVIGIEVPNGRRETVYLSELLSTVEWNRHQGKLTLAIGKDIGGEPVYADLATMPHLLIAGTTGSGKSVGINAMILSLLYRLSPDQCRLIMIDPKMLELSVYDGIPHLLAPVVTDPKKAVTALKWTVREMERRYRAMSQLGVRNIGGYNERVSDARARGEVVTRRVQTGFDEDTNRPIFEEQPLALEPLPFIVVLIDEMADLMMVAGKEIEAAVQRLAQMARAAGIHVIMATQRPSVDVITGTIKANFPNRISFQVISKFDSRTILGEQGAEQLLGKGDLLHMVGGGRISRVHGPYVADREVEDVVAFLRAQGEPSYMDEVTEAEPEDGDDGSNPMLTGIAAASDGEKSLFDQAVAVVAREGKASTSFIQRHLQIGYNRAAKLIEQMEKEGVVSPANHVGKREVLVRRTHEDD
jgi:S-DNA-T family DNA segregation ATPase FtsK/SpoIIIE